MDRYGKEHQESKGQGQEPYFLENGYTPFLFKPFPWGDSINLALNEVFFALNPRENPASLIRPYRRQRCPSATIPADL
jgi:hypothetical protein